MKLGVYMGPSGQLVDVFYYRDLDMYRTSVLSIQTSERHSYWLENGSMTETIYYLLDGWTYLGKL